MRLQKKRLGPIFIMVLSLMAAAANAQLIDLPPKGTSFGTELVNLLLKQLEGKSTAYTSNDTIIIIYFKK